MHTPKRPTSWRRSGVAVILGAAAALPGACGGDAAAPDKPQQPAATAPVTNAADLAAADADADATAGGDASAAAASSDDPADYPDLRIETLREGTGDVVLTADKKAKVHYTGTLLNGKQFDSSWDKGTTPAEFDLGGVVKGFRVGLLGMKVGERRRIVVPGELGYGKAGNLAAGIQPDATLIFDVELVEVVER